jgi:hypothetical protein
LRDILKRLRKNPSTEAALLSDEVRKEENFGEQSERECFIDQRQEAVAVKVGPTSMEISNEEYLLTMDVVDDQASCILDEDIDTWSNDSESEYCDLLENQEVDNSVFEGIKSALDIDTLFFNNDQATDFSPTCQSNTMDGRPTQS